MKNTKTIVVVPEITKPKMLAAENINTNSAGLILLTFLLAHRAQISATLNQLQKQDIQRLESIKWNAKQIAKNPIIKSFAVRLVVAETINYEFNNISNFTKEQLEEVVETIVQDLENSSPNRDAKILNPRAINTSNLKNHRLAKLAQLNGIWQARPIFEPNTIIKNHPAAALGPDEFTNTIIDLHESFGINLDPKLQSLIVESGNKTESLKTVINDLFAESLQSGGTNLTFNDTIDFKSPNNLTPLEGFMPFISRPLPDTLLHNQGSLPNELLSNPLFSYGASINAALTRENKNSGFAQSPFPSVNNVQNSAKPKPKGQATAKNRTTKPKPKK